jgi:G:T-mismatch repair DNA endonuclease (very short patch repair protein)
MILEEATYDAFNHYPSKLKLQSGKLILAACETCGEFKVTTKNHYYTFCNSCSSILTGKNKGEKAPMFGKKHTEKTKALISATKNPKKTECICKTCGKKYHRFPSDIKRGNGKYCCHSCAIKAHRHNTPPCITLPERTFQRLCINNDLPFKFVGDGSLWLGNANPDFIHNTKKIVVEVFGDYFHSPLLNRKVRDTATLEGRCKQLKAEGYKCIFIWESDLKRKDAEAFVMNLMRKEKIV